MQGTMRVDKSCIVGNPFLSLHSSGDVWVKLTWPSSLTSSSALVEVLDDGFRTAVNVEFFVNAFDVGPHRADRYIHGRGDLFVGAAVGQKLEHFLFARGQ